ncbi:MAG: acetolactate decarboxylase [Synergistaceae bacterium]|nr:acetolactate decarboxylase [Synergistaceae bacterium]
MSNQKRRFRFSSVVLALIVLVCAYFTFAKPCCKNCSPTVTQFSTINALVEGNYDGVATMGCLKKAGDFGIGCVEPLDGELAVLDGEAYQIRFDGSVHKLTDEIKTPFAAVLKFKSSREGQVSNVPDLAELIKYLDTLIPESNMLVAVRITGVFDHVHTRSVPPQKKPYPRLSDVTKNQPEFEADNQEGDIIAFRLPEYLAGVNATGWHMHFLSKDKKFGGHLLGISTKNASVKVCLSREFRMVLPPEGHDFYKTNLSKDTTDELKTIETAK